MSQTPYIFDRHPYCKSPNCAPECKGECAAKDEQPQNFTPLQSMQRLSTVCLRWDHNSLTSEEAITQIKQIIDNTSLPG